MRRGLVLWGHLLTPGSHCGERSFSCLSVGILFGTCKATGHHLAPLMMSKSCLSFEGFTVCISLISNLGLFWFISWPSESRRNFSCLLCTTWKYMGPSGSHGSTSKFYFDHRSTCPCIARPPWGSVCSFQDIPWKGRLSWLSVLFCQASLGVLLFSILKPRPREVGWWELSQWPT